MAVIMNYSYEDIVKIKNDREKYGRYFEFYYKGIKCVLDSKLYHAIWNLLFCFRETYHVGNLICLPETKYMVPLRVDLSEKTGMDHPKEKYYSVSDYCQTAITCINEDKFQRQ